MTYGEIYKKVMDGLECIDMPSDECLIDNCPYEKFWPALCLQQIVKDALSMLKEQGPRVLTLEEVKDSIGEAIYFESRGTYMGKVIFPILPALFTPHGLMRYVHPQSSHYSELGLHDYGKVWRCWSARPTEEQRKAVKWDD